MRPLPFVAFSFWLSSLSGLSLAQPNATLTSKQIFERASAATVLILTGEGAGRLHGTATGVIISKDGILLTALHVVKGAAEVQVRLANGEIFDHVELLGTDERRDIAALRIPAAALPALTPGSSAALSQGDSIYAVTNANGLSWSATEGILSAVRPAEEVQGAGSGFRLLQFTAPVASGASGGALVNSSGALVGIITSGIGGSAAFAVPIESVLGLPESGRRTTLGAGSSLQLPAKMAADAPQSSTALDGVSPTHLLKSAKTIFISSKTSFLTVDTLDRALLLQKDWDKLGLTIVQDQRVADVLLTIDRPLFTYVHTFVLSDKKTSIVLASGKVTAFDGTIASGPLAKDIVKAFASARLPAKKEAREDASAR